MGGAFSCCCGGGGGGERSAELEMALSKVKEIVSSTPAVVFSKTYCSYCTRVKQLLTQLGATYKLIELDVDRDGAETQAALVEWTGQRTVPNVFIGGKHIGGCDGKIFDPSIPPFCVSVAKPPSTKHILGFFLSGSDVMALHNEGKLVPLLTDAGAIAK